MKLKIHITIDLNKTWSEICGGKIKPIINFNLGRLKKHLKKYIPNINIETQWLVQDDINCEKCIYHEINKESPVFRSLNEKDNVEVFNGCIINHMGVPITDIEKFQNLGQCSYYQPCEKYCQSLPYNEYRKLLKELEEQIETSE